MTTSKLIKNLSRFRLITFDVTDTLLKLSAPPAIQYSKTALQFGHHVDENKLKSSFRIEFKRMLELHPNFGRETCMEWKKWWQILVYNIFNAADAQISDQDLEKIAEKLIIQYRTDECWHKIEGADQLINKIKQIDKKVGIISNFDPSLHDIIETMRLPKFDFVLTSFEHNSFKPDKKIFEKALDITKCKESEALHIGNTFELDYIGAKNAGWSSLLIGNQIELSQFVKKTHIFNSLDNLLETLENCEISW